MKQLSLPISPRLTYSPGRFIRHSGVSAIFSRVSCPGGAPLPTFSFIQGAPRTGKTHFAVALFDELSLQGRYPTFLPSDDFLESIQQRMRLGQTRQGDVLLVDDADEGLERSVSTSSGQVVAAFESVRHTGGSLILFSRRRIDELPCDDHVLSRLRSGESFCIGHPGEEDLPRLLASMGLQRGLKLGERELSFLCRRLRRDIRSLEHYFERLLHLSELLGVPVKRGLLGQLTEP